jgi:hypothetical protein
MRAQRSPGFVTTRQIHRGSSSPLAHRQRWNQGEFGHISGSFAGNGISWRRRTFTICSSTPHRASVFRQRWLLNTREHRTEYVAPADWGMEARMTSEPGFDRGRFVRAMVVHHQMQIQVRRHAGFDGAQKAHEFAAAMAPMYLADHSTSSDVQRREQRGRTVAHVIVGASLRDARCQRQHGLRAIGCLNLALPIPMREIIRDRIKRVEIRWAVTPKATLCKSWPRQLEAILMPALGPGKNVSQSPVESAGLSKVVEYSSIHT